MNNKFCKDNNMEKDIKIDKLIGLIRRFEIVATDLDIALSHSRTLLEEYYVEDLLRQMVGERTKLSKEDLLDKVKDEEILKEIERLEYENENYFRKKLENGRTNSWIIDPKPQKENNAKIRLLEKIQDQKLLLKAKREDKKKKLKKDL